MKIVVIYKNKRTLKYLGKYCGNNGKYSDIRVQPS